MVPDLSLQPGRFAYEWRECYSAVAEYTRNLLPRPLSHLGQGIYEALPLLEIAEASPPYLGRKPTLARLLIDNDRPFRPDPSLFPKRESLTADAIRKAGFGVVLSSSYNSARIALSKPLKSPLTRSVTSTTSSWLSSSWKPAAKLVIHEIPRTFKPE